MRSCHHCHCFIHPVSGHQASLDLSHTPLPLSPSHPFFSLTHTHTHKYKHMHSATLQLLEIRGLQRCAVVILRIFSDYVDTMSRPLIHFALCPEICGNLNLFHFDCICVVVVCCCWWFLNYILPRKAAFPSEQVKHLNRARVNNSPATVPVLCSLSPSGLFSFFVASSWNISCDDIETSKCRISKSHVVTIIVIGSIIKS